ncbi:MAG: hypothetical protein MZU97_06620 [Bacillus subtilis]|nr:hypothetical protein [Bacillus subtilis]
MPTKGVYLQARALQDRSRARDGGQEAVRQARGRRRKPIPSGGYERPRRTSPQRKRGLTSRR